jgi:hypothetical protein
MYFLKFPYPDISETYFTSAIFLKEPIKLAEYKFQFYL